MFEYFKRKKAEREKLEKEKLEKRKLELEQEKGKLEDEMFSTYCPIINKNCTQECIHFRSGHIYLFFDTYTLVQPRCKLWK